MGFKKWLLIAGLVMPISLACKQAAIKVQEGAKPVQFFSGKEAVLQRAIDADDPAALQTAVQAGADVNAKGLYGGTPLEYAIVHFRKTAFGELLRLKADTALRDNDGDNAITVATRAYAKDPDYLLMALKAGGDPNTRRHDGDPIIIRFVNDLNLDAIRMMKQNGADINISDRGGDPIVVTAAISGHWDVVWCLLDLGAKFDFPERPFNMVNAFDNPKATPPDSPVFPDKVKCWKFLKAHGLKLPDLKGADQITN